MTTIHVFELSFLALCSGPIGIAGDWPQFRGPNGAGVSAETNLPSEWGPDEHVAWKVTIPGYGWSSPIVSGDKLFVTTAVSEKQRAPQRRGPGGGEPAPPNDLYCWEVHCLDAETGKTLWQRVAAKRKPPIATHVSNTYASETPVTDGERVYAYFAMVGVFCYDLSGDLVWSKDLDAHRMFANWGTSSSPVLDGDRLFVQCDNEAQSFVVALDKNTGDELWHASRPERSTWSTPVVWRNTMRTELVLMGSRRIRSYDPSTGKVLWELATDEVSGAGRLQPAPGKSAAGKTEPGKPAAGKSATGKPAAGGCKSTPVATRDMIYLGMASKVQGQSLGPMWAVKAGATGDISLKPGERSGAHIAWYRPDAGPHFASAVVTDGLLYVVTPHGGELRCYDANTGADVYQQRIPGAGDFKASPWAAGGKVFAVDENGTTFVIAAGPAFKCVAMNALDELTWSSPAPARGAIFIRSVEHLYCIRAVGISD
jgi:outer membrane protein assembly factor BamB